MTDQTAADERETQRDQDIVSHIQSLLETDRESAIRKAIVALGQGVRHPLVHHLVAEGLEEDNRLEDAAALLWEARGFAPRDPLVLNSLGILFTRMNRAYEGLDIFDEALAVAPDLFYLHSNKGLAAATAGEPTLARRHYERAAALAPSVPGPLESLADLAARQGQMADARRFAEQAMSLRPSLVTPQLVLAQSERAAGAPETAERRVRSLLNNPDLEEEQRGLCLAQLADILDAEGRYGEAFRAYDLANASFRHVNAPLYESRREATLGYVVSHGEALERLPAGDWTAAPGSLESPVREHVFLMGFARSGTTLLEQVISGHPDVVALGEKPTLEQAALDYLNGGDGFDRLARLGAEEADAAREAYWQVVRRYARQDIAGKVLVDKHPLNTARLPLIAKLFPRAKILFIRRDPRDVVLSCLRRHFRMNTSTYKFLTLEGAARYYDAVMRVGQLSMEKLPLDVHVVRQEGLVEDFEGQATAALRFIGADWYPGAWDFSKRAVTAANTPSAAQLARGLTSETVGLWRRYAADLLPVLPVLEPWVRAFGYEPADMNAIEAERRARPPADLGLPTPAQAAARRDEALRRLQAATARGDFNQAFTLAENALAAGLEHPYFHRLRGALREQQGRLREAIAEFETALDANPKDAGLLNVLGLCLAREGRVSDALVRLRGSIELRPDFAPAHYNLGWALEASGDLVAARAAYARATQLDPNYADALAAFAALQARAGGAAEAAEAAKRALAIDAGQPVARTALASAEVMLGDAPSAERRLREVIADTRRTGDHERAVALGALGDSLDAQGRTDEAFAAYEAGAATFRTLYGARFAGPGVESATAMAARLREGIAGADPAAWRRAAAPAAEQAAGHVFVLGFPRSGTTLMGQVLAGGAGVVTLDEHETLADAAEAFLRPPGGLQRLENIGEAEIARFRDLYWRRVRDAGVEPAGKVFVDKLPMNTLGLPLIAKLFPQARVLFMQRDPRDVVISCFRRQFAINATTFEFLTLEGAARLYDAVMDVTDAYERVLDVTLRRQTYEALVTDFEAQTRAICGFLGLDWSPAMADIAAGARRVATPSAAQLAGGLSADSIGGWRRYADQLRPVMPILEPWVARFGAPG